MKPESIKQCDEALIIKAQIGVIGTIKRIQKGCVVEYTDAYFHSTHSHGISTALSKKQKKFEIRGSNLPCFFAGLLPEGLRFSSLAESLKTSKDDLFSLLLAAGTETVGDIWVMPTENDFFNHFSDLRLEKTLSPKTISQLDVRALTADVFSTNTQFAGVQKKISSAVLSFFARSDTAQKTLTPAGLKKLYARKCSGELLGQHKFVVKLNPNDKQNLVQNESFFMKMAKDCGLSVAHCDLAFDNKSIPVLFVRRFRFKDKSTKTILAYHQEDACQFLDVYPSEKYRLSLQDIAKGLQKWCSAPAIEILSLIKMYAFAYLIGNGDLHAKNISILTHPTTGLTQLSPAYDVLSTLPYGDDRMALQMLGKDKNLLTKDFLAFAKAFGIPAKPVHILLQELCDKIGPWLSRLEEAGLNRKQVVFLKKTAVERRTGLLER